MGWSEKAGWEKWDIRACIHSLLNSALLNRSSSSEPKHTEGVFAQLFSHSKNGMWLV